MRPKRSRALRVESLESLVLLNAGLPQPPSHPAAQVANATLARRVALNGLLSGTLVQLFSIPDTGGHYHLEGFGKIRPVGQAKGDGTFTTPGFIANGQIQGTLTLASSSGSVTLNLQGPTVPGFTRLSSGTFSYTITQGTGQFRNAKGHGSAVLTFGPLNPIPGATGPSQNRPISEAAFTLSFKASH